ncbi:hypothetical protein [Nocardia cyriacigeorgica]|uniref:hypothetical protein n=1 Tax=Nocardia cyriacigeorgica TaxID=135487 RepID=UPI0024578FC6|nr:hypothetical protein [Nocardia cyriacigeorgica]
MAEFRSWDQTELRSHADIEGGARLRGKATVSAKVDITDQIVTGDTEFEVLGPGDVRELCRAAITRRYPAPGATDAEETKVALVELRSPDLPWRYTPLAPHGTLRPWLVLVVGVPTDVAPTSDGRRVQLSVAAQGAHPLASSWRWAHVHEVAGRPIGRILNPIDLRSGQVYNACLVPAFRVDRDGTLRDAWAGTQPVTVPCFDQWTFRTGAEGDFPDIAKRLHRADLEALAERAGKPLGQAEIRYRRRGTGTPEQTMLATFGALKRPDAPAAGVVPSWAAAEVRALTDRVVSPDGRPVITAPRYPAPFTSSTTGGWVDQLTADPRHRGAAGLGAWAAIEWQEKITAAAAVRAGELSIAAGRLADLALGVGAARSMWRRHVPKDPVAALAVLAPVLGRLPTTTMNLSVLRAVTSAASPLPRALFSSAARRVLRRGPARTALAKPGACDPGAVLVVAGDCRNQPRPPPRFDVEVVEHALTSGSLDDTTIERLRRMLRPEDGFGVERLSGTDERFPVRPCSSVDIHLLGVKVADAVDPTRPRPPAVERVLATLPGIDSFGPIEIEPELDLPLWQFLCERSPDWMLPGAGDLAMDEVVALSTNPEFVNGLLTGANHQTQAELRWRNLPIRTGWSPLRKFWQRAAGTLDIRPIKTWPAADSLGAPSQLVNSPAAEAVVLFRSTLFRRYPATAVYLFATRTTGDKWAPPLANDPLTARVEPVFRGAITDELVFFGFPIAPEDLADYWVVLEEPPSGYRFYHCADDDAEPVAEDDTAAEFGKHTFALPVRILIGPLLEEHP